MRILFVVLNFSPEPTGAGKFTGELAQHFQRQGHEVKVVSAPPYYPWWKVKPPYSRSWYQRENIGGVEVLRCPLYVPECPTGLRRIVHLLTLGVSLLPALAWTWRFKPDLVFNVQPTLTTSVAAAIAAKLHGASLWHHVQDLEVAAAEQLGIIPCWMRSLVARLERFCYSRCEGLSTISPAMQKQLRLRGVSIEPAIFPNWVDTEAIHPRKGSSYRDELGISEDATVVLYSGNMGEKQGLEIVLEAARRTADDGILFILAGDGASRQRLEEMARMLGNVRFLPIQPADRMCEFLALGDIHLVPQKAGFGDCVMPSKMAAILAAGRPCVVTALPEDELSVIANQCGVSVLPGDADGFADAILSLARSPELRNARGENARRHALEHLSAAAILPRMEAFAEGVLGG